MFRRVKTFFKVAAFTAVYLVSMSTSTHAQSEADIWKITNFAVNIAVSDEDKIEVNEQIDAIFFTEKHGIFRNIPVKYSARGVFDPRISIDVTVNSVTDDQGNPWNYTVSTQGDYLQIKIGDPDVFISGVQQYNISYTAEGVIDFYENHDELFWNVTGNEWPVEIEQSSAFVSFSEAFDLSKIEIRCFTGSQGSTDENCETSQGENKYIFTPEQSFQPYQGFSVVLGMPKDIIEEPTFLERYGRLILVNSGILLPIPMAFFLLVAWLRFGRDPKGRGTVMPQFDAPDKLTPGEVGVLIDNNADNVDISATIIDLAIRGYIKIEELEKKLLRQQDYKFHLENNDLSTLESHERELLEGVFGKGASAGATKKLSDLRNNFHTKMSSIKRNLTDKMVEKGYFTQNPNRLRNVFLVIGILLGAGTLFFVMAPLLALGGVGTVLGLLISAGMVAIVGFWMPKRTEKGSLTLEHIEGLKLYIETAEKERLEVLQGPDSEYAKQTAEVYETDAEEGEASSKERGTPQKSVKKTIKLFEKLLPFAMVLKVEKQWAAKFEGIYTQPPSWYTGHNWSTFNTLYLVNSLNTVSSDVNSAFVSAPRSSGSGFSGGGFSGGGSGGGGGGSW